MTDHSITDPSPASNDQESVMSEPVKIAIVLEGGVVSSVLSAGIAVEFVVVDYDVDGAEPGETIAVPQDGLPGKTAEAYVDDPKVAEVGRPFVLGAFDRFGRPGQ